MGTIGQLLSKLFVLTLVLLLVLAFALWGVGDLFRGSSTQTVAKVGEYEITQNEVNNFVNQQIRRFQQQYQQAIPDEMREMIRNQTLQILVNQYLLLNAVNALKIDVNKEAVLDAVKQNEQFFTEDGTFNTLAFQQTLNAMGLSEAEFIETSRREIAIGFILDSFMTRLPVTPEQVKQLYNYEGEQRSFKTLTLDDSLITDIPEPTEVELISFYEEQQGRFDAPEYRDITYITFNSNIVADEIDLSEERLRAIYEENIVSYSIPEKRELKQVVLDDQPQAERIVALVKAGKSFADAVVEVTGSDKGITNLDTLSKNELRQGGLLGEDIVEAVFALNEGGVSEPQESPLGYHIFQVAAIETGSIQPFEEARRDIKRDILAEEAEPLLYDIATKIEDAIAGGANLQEIATNFGLRVETLENIDREGRTQSGTPPILPAFPDFLDTVFVMDTEEISNVIGSDDGMSYYTAQVTDITPSRSRALDEVRGSVIIAWKEQRQQALLLERANAVAEAVKQTENPLNTLQEQADQLSLTIKEQTRIVRSEAAQSGLPEALVSEAFSLAVGQATKAHETPIGSYVIAVIASVTPAEDNPAFKRTTAEILLREGLQNDMVEQYLNHLRSTYPVEFTALSASDTL